MSSTGNSESRVDDTNFGFPVGYFVIKSVATGRLLDIERDAVEDGAEVVLWPEKEKSLVESAFSYSTPGVTMH